MASVAPARAMPATLADRISGALWGMHIADALAMPAHWYYGGPSQIAADYGGPITGYVQPPMNLAGSIMNKSNTGGAGRGGFQGSIIGDVICHGKKPYWSPSKSHHYHCTLQKGENTLEMQLTRVVYTGITGNQATFSADVLRQHYVDFMTTPGSHNDCYASTCHRMFFANRAGGTPLEQCPDNDAHNVDTLDGLVMALPVALATLDRPAAEAHEQVASCVGVTRRSRECQRYAAVLGDALQRVVKGDGLAGVVEDLAGRSMADTVRRPDPMTA